MQCLGEWWEDEGTRKGENAASVDVVYERRAEVHRAEGREDFRRGWLWKHESYAASEAYLIKVSKTMLPLQYHSKIGSDSCPLTAAASKEVHLNVLFGPFPLPPPSPNLRALTPTHREYINPLARA